MRLFALVMKPLGICGLQEVVPTGHGIEVVGIEVRYRYFVARVAQGRGGGRCERRVERLRLRMGMDDQYLHAGAPSGTGASSIETFRGNKWTSNAPTTIAADIK